MINAKSGFSLVEVIIASSILVSFISAILIGTNLYLKRSDQNKNDVKIGFLLEEGIEALKTMRDESWTNKINPLNEGQDYYLYFYAGKWTSTTTPQYTDNAYLRSFVLDEAYRDGNNDLSDSGTLDSNTLLATVEVSWFDTKEQATTTKSLSYYLINAFAN
jgi:prepilin-type N-terminal cleavage/methylation domain-containing protein